MKKINKQIDKRTVNLRTGKGGEAAVMSELLFRGYNASLLSVDAGIDIAALKDGRTYLIQVKTKHWSKRSQFLVNLELGALNRYVESNAFLVLVGRDRATKLNDYIILPIKVLDDTSKGLRLKVNKKGKDFFNFIFRKRKDGEITLGKYGPITKYKNAWGLIK